MIKYFASTAFIFAALWIGLALWGGPWPMLIIIPVGMYVLLMFYNRMEGDGTPTFTYEETKRTHEQKKQDKSR